MYSEQNFKKSKVAKVAKKGLFRIVFSRTGIMLLLILIQLGIFIMIPYYLNAYTTYIYGAFRAVSLLVLIHIINSKGNPAFKMTWTLCVLVFPVVGSLFYLFVQCQIGTKFLKARLAELKIDTDPYMQQDQEIVEAIWASKSANAHLSYFLSHQVGFPTYRNTAVKYFPLGEDKFASMVQELKKAKKFIFMEYFIVEEGYMWETILDILKEKAAEGVEVRFMYDGMCAISMLPYDYPELIRSYGMLKGDAVQSFTMMFLQMWNIEARKPEDYRKYLTPKVKGLRRELGYVIPYADSPYDDENVGEEVYFHILNHAKKYVHIMTPYLILDNEMITTLTRVAKCGIEVIIIMPHIPDKWYAFAVAKTYYKELIESGVQIYEYTPGFVHAKVFVSDDDTATVGSINLDYRSLYLHFECGVFIYNNSEVDKVERDFQQTLAKSHKVTLMEVKKQTLATKISGQVLRLIAPLM